MTVRVLVSTQISAGEEEKFEHAFADVASRMRGTPGHIRDELLCDVGDPSSYVLVGEWSSRDDFQAWFDAPEHPAMTTPMRQYWSGRARHGVYEIAVRVERRR